MYFWNPTIAGPEVWAVQHKYLKTIVGSKSYWSTKSRFWILFKKVRRAVRQHHHQNYLPEYMLPVQSKRICWLVVLLQRCSFWLESSFIIRYCAYYRSFHYSKKIWFVYVNKLHNSNKLLFWKLFHLPPRKKYRAFSERYSYNDHSTIVEFST